MGVIPERQRRQLASSAVGTVGVDRSAGFVTGNLIGIAERMEAEERKQLVANQQAATKRQGFVSKTSANNGLVQFNREMNKLGLKARDQQEYDDGVDGLLKSFQGSFGDDAHATSLFTEDAVRITKSRGDDFFVLNEQRKVDEVSSLLDDSTEEMIDGVIEAFGGRGPNANVSLPQKMQFFHQQLDLIDKVTADAGDMLSPDAARKYNEESKITMAQEAVSALMENRPEQVEDFLGIIENLGWFEDDELEAIKKEAIKKGETQDKLAQLTLSKAQNSRGTEMQTLIQSDPNAFTDSEIRRAGFKGEISKEDEKRFLRYKNSGEKLSARDSAEAYASIETQLAAIDWKATPEGEGLAQIALVRNHVMDAMADGTVTQAVGQRLLRVVTPKFNETIDTLFKSINNRTVAIGSWTNDLVSQVLTDPEEILAAKFRLGDDLMGRIDEWEDKKGGRASLSEMRKILTVAQDEFVHSKNPNRSVYALNEVVLRNGKKWVITGFNKAGFPILNDDLSKRTSELPNNDLIEIYADRFGKLSTVEGKSDFNDQILQGTTIAKDLPKAVQRLKETSGEFRQELKDAQDFGGAE